MNSWLCSALGDWKHMNINRNICLKTLIHRRQEELRLSVFSGEAHTVTKIDRYVLTLFLRTVVICFCSLAGIFVVFHAFTSMEDLLRQAEKDGGLLIVMFRYYGPYLLLLFDWTGAIIALMAFLFTIGWLRGTRGVDRDVIDWSIARKNF